MPRDRDSAGKCHVPRVGSAGNRIAAGQRPGNSSRASSCCAGRRDAAMTKFDEALDLLIGSEPFDRLLADAGHPHVARAEAGQDFVLAALARALDGAVMSVTTGPHEAEALARGVAAYLGEDRVVLFPAWESLPYEGISPAPEVAARLAMAARRMRAASGGAFVVVAPALA